MIKMITKEYREDNLAVRDICIKLFNIPIFKHKKTSTNSVAISQLTGPRERAKIKGFNNEIANKN